MIRAAPYPAPSVARRCRFGQLLKPLLRVCGSNAKTRPAAGK
nr:MAG TPA: hypothetical protein [Caudoviricetes sp.]